MKLAKFLTPAGKVALGVVEGDVVRPLSLDGGQYQTLTEILESNDPAETVRFLVDPSAATFAVADITFLPPIDNQEVWAAGVTYKRSRSARMEESVSSATVYDLVYSADRPEIFFKSSAVKVVGDDKPVRIRKDSTWNVPEPELALVVDRRGQIVGYTIGNDMSSRDIEGENPLYLPQAKVYDESCSLGPWITLAGGMPSLERTIISIDIKRSGKSVFAGKTSAAELNRTPASLVEWLYRENTFPHGAVLLTGTGVVPDKDFTLLPGDVVAITIEGIGTLTNTVVQRK